MHLTDDNTLVDSFVGSALGGFSATLLQIIPTGIMIFGVVIMIFSGIRVAHTAARGHMEDLGGVGLGIAMVVFGFLSPVLFGLLSEPETDTDNAPAPTATGTPTATSSPTPTSTPRTTAPPTSEPADLTPMFITLGIIAGLVLTLILVLLLVTAIQRARRGIRSSRELAAAQRATAERQAATWQAFRDRHDELLRKILHAETDWDALFFTPALTDPNVPQTYAMLRAMRAAGTLRDTAGTLPAGLDDDADLTELPYPNAVEEFAAAWDAAERHARRVGQKGIPATERKTISGIRTLLDIAENSAASATERNIAYRRAQTLIAELESIHIPARAIAQLEEHHRLMLTAGQDA